VTDPEGLLLVDKPGGMTSHDVVDVVRRTLRTRKVGHAGTLDPMATGLLVLGVGRATRLLRFLGDLPKTYEGSARLGVETTTLDADGDTTAERPVSSTEDDVRSAMTALIGESLQTPPAYSAVKVGGRKLYEAARKGEMLEAAPRPIRVDAFALTGYRASGSSRRLLPRYGKISSGWKLVSSAGGSGGIGEAGLASGMGSHPTEMRGLDRRLRRMAG